MILFNSSLMLILSKIPPTILNHLLAANITPVFYLICNKCCVLYTYIGKVKIQGWSAVLPNMRKTRSRRFVQRGQILFWVCFSCWSWRACKRSFLVIGGTCSSSSSPTIVTLLELVEYSLLLEVFLEDAKKLAYNCAGLKRTNFYHVSQL